MTSRSILLVPAAAILVAGAVVIAGTAWSNPSRGASASEGTASSRNGTERGSAAPAEMGQRIVFRNTTPDDDYGLVASVPLADPGGPRVVTDVACDRVYATTSNEMCLRIDRGIVTEFTATLFDASGEEVQSWPLPGFPSRTRISPDSRLVASTAFVTKASYATVGFSTQTTISSTDGSDYGNLEDFALTVDGRPLTAADRNLWGVTFSADDDNLFYATLASGGKTWLMRGNLAARSLVAIKETAECPSLSPDGTRIAYKKNISDSSIPYWSIAVLDLASGQETILPEKRNVDDQMEWLDDSTLLYGLARDGAVGDSDIWSIPADGTADPRLLIEHAWSPSVVRS